MTILVRPLNWVSSVGNNIDCLEHEMGEYMQNLYAIAVSSGIVAIHLVLKLAIKYIRKHRKQIGHSRRRSFCSDLTFAASVNFVSYESGEVIDSDEMSWNVSLGALEKAFEM